MTMEKPMAKFSLFMCSINKQSYLFNQMEPFKKGLNSHHQFIRRSEPAQYPFAAEATTLISSRSLRIILNNLKCTMLFAKFVGEGLRSVIFVYDDSLLLPFFDIHIDV